MKKRHLPIPVWRRMAARKRFMRDMRRVAREAEESKQRDQENGPILVDYTSHGPAGSVNGETVSRLTEECDPCGEPPTDI